MPSVSVQEHFPHHSQGTLSLSQKTEPSKVNTPARTFINTCISSEPVRVDILPLVLSMANPITCSLALIFLA